MITHPDPHAEKVARLRELAQRMRNGADVYPPIEIGTALREYADLLEKSRQGVTEDVVKVAMQGYRRSVAEQAGNWSNNDDSPLKAMHAAILAVAPLLAAMPQFGKEGG